MKHRAVQQAARGLVAFDSASIRAQPSPELAQLVAGRSGLKPTYVLALRQLQEKCNPEAVLWRVYTAERLKSAVGDGCGSVQLLLNEPLAENVVAFSDRTLPGTP